MKKFILLTLLIFINSSYEDIRKEQDKKYEIKYNEQIDEYNKIKNEINESIQLIKIHKENRDDFSKIVAAVSPMNQIKYNIYIFSINSRNDKLKEERLILDKEIEKNIKELKNIIETKKHKYPFVEKFIKEIEDLKNDESTQRDSILNDEKEEFFKITNDNYTYSVEIPFYTNKTQDSNLEKTNNNKTESLTTKNKIVVGMVSISACGFIYYLWKKFFSKINNSDKTKKITNQKI